MTRTIITTGVGLLISALAFAAQQPHWGYSGELGPAHWGELSPAFALCSTGKNQAPIDLTAMVEAELPPIEFNYNTYPTVIVNDGHTVRADYAAGSTISLDGRVFELKQFHFHVPGENLIEGYSFPMEAHLVHADANGNLAIVAVMFKEGKANDTIDALRNQMPTRSGDKYTLSSNISATGLLPNNREYYRFNGSLTTPPCTEGVWWIVMKEPVSASNQQIKAFVRALGGPNNRPVQPINARPVLQ